MSPTSTGLIRKLLRWLSPRLARTSPRRPHLPPSPRRACGTFVPSTGCGASPFWPSCSITSPRRRARRLPRCRPVLRAEWLPDHELAGERMGRHGSARAPVLLVATRATSSSRVFLVLAAVGVYAVVYLDQVDAHHVAVDGVSSLFYVANWHFIDSGQTYIQQFLAQAPSPLRHMWSLAIEEQFYLVWPILVLGVSKVVGRRTAPASRQRRRFQHALLAVCVVLGVASLLRMISLFQSGSGPTASTTALTPARSSCSSARHSPRSARAYLRCRRSLRGAVVFAGCCSAVVLIVAMTIDHHRFVVALHRRVRAPRRDHGRGPPWRRAAGCEPDSRGCSRRVHSSVSDSSRTACTSGTGRSRCGSRLTTPVSTASRSSPFGPRSRSRLRWPATSSSRCRSVVVTCRASAPPSQPRRRADRVRRRARGVARGPRARVPLGRETRRWSACAAVGSAVVTAGYEGAPRCDGGPAPVPIKPNRQLTVQLSGTRLPVRSRTASGRSSEAREREARRREPGRFPPVRRDPFHHRANEQPGDPSPGGDPVLVRRVRPAVW